MGSSGMGVDANGKPIKRQQPQNNNNKKKQPANNQKKGNNNKGNNKNQANRIGNGGGGRPQQPIQHHPNNRPMQMVPPFAPMGHIGFSMAPHPAANLNFFGGAMNNRRNSGGKSNGNRNGAQQPGYNGPSAGNVGQAPIGNNMNAFGSAESQPPSSMDVPGFGKNSNIHELFGKMVWRKMEQIEDSATVDQLQRRIMNLIHDALASQTEQKSRPPPFVVPTNQKGAAFNNNGNNGAPAFARMY